MIIVYRLIASETDQELARVYFDGRASYQLVPGPSPDMDGWIVESPFNRLYPNKQDAFEALGERFAHVPVHVVNG